MKIVYLKNFGCKVNAAELLEAGGALKDAGCRVIEIQSHNEIPAQSNATLIVNSCTVTAAADAKLRGFVRRVRKHAPNLQVVVGGCTVRAEHFDKSALAGALAVPRVEDAVAIVARAADAEFVAMDTLDALRENGAIDAHFGRTREFVRVQDGCDCRCSFCIVPLVRPAFSIPFDDVRTHLDRAIARGAREIVLTGTNIGKYRVADDTSFADVFGFALDRAERTRAEGAPMRVRVSSIEPEDVDDAILDLFAHSAACKHIHLPLQSGSPRVLAAMQRRYGIERYMQVVSKFRSRFPIGSISTDILVGFPTETDDDFAETLSSMRHCGFERVHVFRYSPRPGTRAATQKQVQDAVTFARMKTAIELGDKIVLARMGRHIGETAEVLVERKRSGICEGYSGEYHRVRFPCPDARTGSFAQVAIERIDSAGLFAGRIVASGSPAQAISSVDSEGELR